MKTIKINFKYFWEGFDPLNNLFVFLLNQNYNVAISDNPDYLFFSVYDNVTWYPNYKMPIINGDFIKIFYTAESCRPIMNKCDWAFSFDYIEDRRHFRLPNYLFEYFREKFYEELNFKELKERKTKFCSFIYSKSSPMRNNLFLKLSKYKKIDSPGKVMNNTVPIGKNKDYADSRNSLKRREEKIEFLKSYKFNIAFEHLSHLGYTTEKIFEPMLAGCIPIYWGNELIHLDFERNNFLNYYDFINEEALINKIIEIDNNEQLYNQYLKRLVLQNNYKIQEETQLKLKKRLKEIFD